MVGSGAAPSSSPESPLGEMGDRLLAEWSVASGWRAPNAPSLIIHHAEAPAPRLGSWAEPASSPALRLAHEPAEGDLAWARLCVARVDSRSLPLQSECFGLVVLCHLVGRGDEPQLMEACRLLQPGGRLLILGLNQWGIQCLTQRRAGALPGIRPLLVRSGLEAQDMTVLGLHAAGIMRLGRPAYLNRGPARIFIPLADLFLMVARRSEPKIMNPVAKSRLRAVGAPSAVAGP